MAPKPTYVPPPGLRTQLDDFKDVVNRKYGLNLESYADLHRFSVTRLNDFWMTVWEFAGVKASVHPSKAIEDDNAVIDEFPSFFKGAQLNLAENLLDPKFHGLAVVSMNESNFSSPDEYSWHDLRELARHYAAALKSSGLQKQEVVALVGSNCIRSLALLLATTAVGGIFASFATDMGSKLLSDRLQLLQPRLLFAESTYVYNGKCHDISDKLDLSIQHLQEGGRNRTIIIGPRQGLKSETSVPYHQSPYSLSFEDFLARDTGARLDFVQVPFNTPAVIMFSSGTTGTPKGIVHSHGGLVVNGRKEYNLHNNFGPGDLFYQYTNIGWTLWNISVHALFVGAAVILYDGSPFYPSPEGFLKALFRLKVTCFGAGPRYYAELQKASVKPRKYCQSLHSIISTGAVLTPALAEWLVEAFGPVCQLCMSGGTEISGSFLQGSRSLPSYAGELAVRGLGMDVAVFGVDGHELPDGESGELVCRKPFPNMPAMFWNDPGRKRYHASYFERFPHVWTHGDFIRVNPATKGIYVLGRSDGVLNPSGVRFGSAEIYNLLGSPRFRDSIADALVVGQQRLSAPYADSAEKVVLFIKCHPEATTGSPPRVRADLDAAIRAQIARDLSRRHVPTHIFETDVVPYNANGKKLEIQVKAVLCEGEAALRRLKLTADEIRQLRAYVPFYQMEKVVAQLSPQVGTGAKL
ncbi:acetoacetate-CoA ligase [Fonsecaea pedrosoi CBS 271.37]|uniref:Unplaced genomic scaffold supercont1.1, whole genome shotgun sequence n=1 Tax=Fonsecaea pedrosoi CBS 271.37 TaxID=1442368 RepID=A0A0D2GY84_9EURO|nr:acetoacetate-CoA ligase [Fonsecaea pedrosoi CBS 271.37]KIW85993.1 acetoacetate-CoA ligase [Fonsecaea pedrosoi CBS 271.37]